MSTEWEMPERRDGEERRRDQRPYEGADRRRKLEERRAQQAARERSEVEALRDEVKNLVDESHSLRGTLMAFAPRSELDKRIKALECQMVQAIDHLLDTRKRAMAMWIAGMIVIVGILTAAVFSMSGLNRRAINVNDARLDRLEEVLHMPDIDERP